MHKVLKGFLFFFVGFVATTAILAGGIIWLVEADPLFGELLIVPLVLLCAGVWFGLYWLLWGAAKHKDAKIVHKRILEQQQEVADYLSRMQAGTNDPPLFHIQADYTKKTASEFALFGTSYLKKLKGTPKYYPVLVLHLLMVGLLAFLCVVSPAFLPMILFFVLISAIARFCVWIAPKHPVELGQVYFAFHDHYIFFSLRNQVLTSNKIIRLSDIEKIYRTPTCYYFYLLGNVRHYLPARNLSEGERHRIAEYFDQRLSSLAKRGYSDRT